MNPSFVLRSEISQLRLKVQANPEGQDSSLGEQVGNCNSASEMICRTRFGNLRSIYGNVYFKRGLLSAIFDFHLEIGGI